MNHLVYLGHVFHIENGLITITPMKSRMEAIQKLLPQLYIGIYVPSICLSVLLQLVIVSSFITMPKGTC